MKKLILLSGLLLCTAFAPRLCSAQAPAQTTKHTTEVLDTIYANDDKNVALFFPNPIRQGITGANHFVFTYNREKEQHFGLLQAKPGKESNLLIINNNGDIFSYIVKYKIHLQRYNYFIPLSTAIGNEKPKEDLLTNLDTLPASRFDKLAYYERFCSYLIKRKQRIGRIKTRQSGIIMTVENIVFDKEELYFVVQVDNRSSLDYDLNFMDFSITTRKKGKKKSLQKLYQTPSYVHKKPARVKKSTSARMVFVLPKFSISNERRVVLELNETNGERNLALFIADHFINHPN